MVRFLDLRQSVLPIEATMKEDGVLMETDEETYLNAVNPSTVTQRSPFRYPGGKTWLIPLIIKWLRQQGSSAELVEPFAGGAISGLTAAFEKLVSKVTLVELDPDVASVWRTILYGDGTQLAHKYASFTLTADSVEAVLKRDNQSLPERAFATLLRNRISRGGIIAPGAGVLKKGENGKGLASRWYPETIRQRILNIVEVRDRISFIQGDGISLLEAWATRPDVVWFIDPPYTVAGKRLYTHSDVDHEHLFYVVRNLAGDFLMTYDESDEVRALAERNGFGVRRVKMKTTHHDQKYELLIGRSLDWADS
ncbi:MAG: DNA adenine methylase [Symbiobacteriia bacterium]